MSLTMNHSITDTEKMQAVLHTFANTLWEKLLDNNVLPINNLKTIYFTTVTELLGEKIDNKIKPKNANPVKLKKLKPKKKYLRHSIPIPFFLKYFNCVSFTTSLTSCEFKLVPPL